MNATATPPPPPSLLNVPMHFLVEDKRLVEVVLAVEGAMLLISRWAGKPCSSSSQMWLTAAPGGVIGGDAVCVVLIWIWCRPPCECWRLSFPSASASTRRRRLMLLGWRVARNDYLGLQMIPWTNSSLVVSKMISISTYLCALSSLSFAECIFERRSQRTG